MLLWFYCGAHKFTYEMYNIIFVKIPTYHFILFPIFYWCTQQTLYVLTYIFCIVTLLNKQKNRVTNFKGCCSGGWSEKAVELGSTTTLGLHPPSKSNHVINDFALKQQAGKLLRLGQRSALFPRLCSVSHSPTEGGWIYLGSGRIEQKDNAPFSNTWGEKAIALLWLLQE